MVAKAIRRISAVALLLLPLLALAYPPTYLAEPIRGQVVDEITREPLEGVIVVAQWALMEDTAHSDYWGASMAITEVVTDRDGRYVVAGWGPLPRPPQKFLYNRDPMLTFFKSGYEPLQLTNELLSEPSTAVTRTSRWNGKTLVLKRAAGTPEEQASRLSSAYTSLYHAYLVPGAEQPPWKFFPRLFVALATEGARLKKLGLRPVYGAGIPDMDSIDVKDRPFLKGFER